MLVHLGIDTVSLGGNGFTVLAQEGHHVAAGDPVVRWHPRQVSAAGLSTVCPVVALDAKADRVTDPAAGPIARGGALFTWA